VEEILVQEMGEEAGEGGRASDCNAGLDPVKGRDKEGGPDREHLRLQHHVREVSIRLRGRPCAKITC